MARLGATVSLAATVLCKLFGEETEPYKVDVGRHSAPLHLLCAPDGPHLEVLLHQQQQQAD